MGTLLWTFTEKEERIYSDKIVCVQTGIYKRSGIKGAAIEKKVKHNSIPAT
jgi:hypothetical protein